MRRPLFAVCFVLCLQSLAVGGEEPADLEALRAEARELAFSKGNRAGARALCRQILEVRPDDVEARVFLGRLYAWDAQYEEARQELEVALATKPEDTDALRAAIDVELWSDRPDAALVLADEGLLIHPEEPTLYARRARALSALERDGDAAVAAEQAMEADPENRDAKRLYRRMLEKTQRNKVQAAYEFESFEDDGTDPWQAASISYRREEPWGSVIGRVNQALRFDQSGTQVELDAYTDLREGTYAYLNAGFSSGELFPSARYGAEVFHNFAHGWEASAGARWLDFDSSDVTIYTGSVARYVGSYWVGVRPTYSTDTNGRSFSGRLFVRRFFNGRYEYTELSAGRGAGTDKSLVAEAGDLDDSSLRFEYRRRVRHSVILLGAVGLRSEELTATQDRESGFVQIGIERLF